MMLHVSAAGRELIERNEGCRLEAYQDIVGVWTIGYGHIEGVQPGDRITQAEADQMLSDDLAQRYEPPVRAAIGNAPTTQGQFDAMVSLAYNVGVSGFAHSTVCREHVAGNYEAAAAAFSLWNKAGGRAIAGLTRRRKEEAALYLSQGAAAVDSPAAHAQATDGPSPFDQIKRVQEVLGVEADGAFGRRSRAALNALLTSAGQPGI